MALPDRPIYYEQPAAAHNPRYRKRNRLLAVATATATASILVASWGLSEQNNTISGNPEAAAAPPVTIVKFEPRSRQLLNLEINIAAVPSINELQEIFRQTPKEKFVTSAVSAGDLGFPDVDNSENFEAVSIPLDVGPNENGENGGRLASLFLSPANGPENKRKIVGIGFINTSKKPQSDTVSSMSMLALFYGKNGWCLEETFMSDSQKSSYSDSVTTGSDVNVIRPDLLADRFRNELDGFTQHWPVSPSTQPPKLVAPPHA